MLVSIAKLVKIAYITNTKIILGGAQDFDYTFAKYFKIESFYNSPAVTLKIVAQYPAKVYNMVLRKQIAEGFFDFRDFDDFDFKASGVNSFKVVAGDDNCVHTEFLSLHDALLNACNGAYLAR